MKNLSKAKLLDFILGEMLKDQRSTKSNSYDSKFIVRLFNKLAKENNSMVTGVYMDSEKAGNLFECIYHETFDESPIIKQSTESSLVNLTGNPYYNTQDFLNAGGFAALYEKENQRLEKKSKKENYDFVNSKNQARLSTKQRITFWITSTFSFIALGLSIYHTFFKTIE